VRGLLQPPLGVASFAHASDVSDCRSGIADLVSKAVKEESEADGALKVWHARHAWAPVARTEHAACSASRRTHRMQGGCWATLTGSWSSRFALRRSHLRNAWLLTLTRVLLRSDGHDVCVRRHVHRRSRPDHEQARHAQSPPFAWLHA
jgi:hypothetical protein